MLSMNIFANRRTVELDQSLELMTVIDGRLEVVETLQPGAIISYRSSRTYSADGREWYRYILIHSASGLSDTEINRINGLTLYITNNIRRMSRRSGYSVDEAERVELVNELIDNCRSRNIPTTRLEIGGVLYEVSNDNVSKLDDDTYVPLTVPEARRMASSCGFELPNDEQLIAIGRFAFRNGNQYRARTILPNDHRDRLPNTNQMMNDPQMKVRARAGKTKLIDGHFKWYSKHGEIYGFARGNNSGTFFHNSTSPAHVSDSSYYDYSHGVRLIRRVR